MKKIFALLLAVALIASLAACGAEPTTAETAATAEETTIAAEETAGAVEETAAVEETEGATEEDDAPVENTEGVAVEATASVEILTNIWNKFSDDEKFPTFGGDTSNMVDGAPGKFDVADTEGLTYTLLVPADQIPNLADASSLVHGMLTNNFTCGVFELNEGVDADAFVEAMKAAVTGNQWMCGMPETLILVKIDGIHVMMAYGVNDAINPLKTHLAEAYPDAQIVVDEALVG